MAIGRATNPAWQLFVLLDIRPDSLDCYLFGDEGGPDVWWMLYDCTRGMVKCAFCLFYVSATTAFNPPKPNRAQSEKKKRKGRTFLALPFKTPKPYFIINITSSQETVSFDPAFIGWRDLLQYFREKGTLAVCTSEKLSYNATLLNYVQLLVIWSV